MLLPQEIYLFGPIYSIARPFDQCFSSFTVGTEVPTVNEVYGKSSVIQEFAVCLSLTQSEEVFSAVESFELGIRNAGRKHSGIKYRSLKSDCLWPLKLNSCAERKVRKRESFISCKMLRKPAVLLGSHDSKRPRWFPELAALMTTTPTPESTG